MITSKIVEDSVLEVLDSSTHPCLSQLLYPQYKRELRTLCEDKMHFTVEIDKKGFRRYKRHSPMPKYIVNLNVEEIKDEFNRHMPEYLVVKNIYEFKTHIKLELEVIKK